MAITTQAELITHLKFLSGQSNLEEADSVRLLNVASDDYVVLQITSDGTWQGGDTSNDGLSRATTTLSTGAVKLSLNAEHLVIREVTLTTSGGVESVLEPFDQSQEQRVDPLSTSQSRPTQYDYEEGHLRFNAYADEDYTVRIHYSRPNKELVVGGDDAVVGIPSIHTEYLVLHAMHRLGFRTSDEARAQVRQELAVWERKIKDYYGRRDEDSKNIIKGRNKVIT